MLADGNTLRGAPLHNPLPAGEKADSVTVTPVSPPAEPRSLAADEIKGVTWFEDTLLSRVTKTLDEAGTADDLRSADAVLSAGLRLSRGTRNHPPLGDDPWRAVQNRLGDRLLAVRRDRLKRLDADDALKLADTWRPLYPP